MSWERRHNQVLPARVVFLAAIMVLCGTVVTERAAAQDEAENKWPERLEPNNFEIGLFPNDSGNMDFRLSGTLRYLDYLSFAINAEYGTYTTTFSIDPIQGTSNRRDINAASDLVKLIWPFSPTGTIAASLEPGIRAQYTYFDYETYGYRDNTDESITFFRQDLATHNTAGGVFADVSVDIASFLGLNARTIYFPLVVIVEDGTKYYSDIDAPVEFSTTNIAQGIELDGRISLDFDSISSTSLGRLNIVGNFYHQFGDYSSENIIALYNWKTTIKSVERLTESVLSIFVNYDLTYLQQYTRVIPSIGVTYERTFENYGGTKSQETIWSLGFSTKL